MFSSSFFPTGCHGFHRHREHLFRLQQLPPLQPAQQLLRCHELRKLWLRVPGGHRCQDGQARAPQPGVHRRRRLGNEPQRDVDLRQGEHPRRGSRVQQRAVGSREKESGQFELNLTTILHELSHSVVAFPEVLNFVCKPTILVPC